MSLPSDAEALDLHALAREVKLAQDSARHIETLTSRYPGFDVPTAYAVSNLVHEMRQAEGAVQVGRKIGFTNPDMWALYGVHNPIWAPIYDRTVVFMTGGKAKCSIAKFSEPKIEPEIVFHFKSSPPTGKGLAAILDAIDWLAHGFEMVQSHFAGWKFKAADVVADWSLHGALYVGEPQPVARLGDDLAGALETFSVSLSCDGAIRETGSGANVLGSPLSAIAHLLAVLAKQPMYKALEAGEIVTTGTITTAQAVRPGETWRTELHGIALPGLALEFMP